MDVKKLLFPVGAKVMAICAFVMEILAVACVVMGIISDVKQKIMWMDPYCWLCLAAALFIYGLWWWLSAYFATKE